MYVLGGEGDREFFAPVAGFELPVPGADIFLLPMLNNIFKKGALNHKQQDVHLSEGMFLLGYDIHIAIIIIKLKLNETTVTSNVFSYT